MYESYSFIAIKNQRKEENKDKLVITKKCDMNGVMS